MSPLPRPLLCHQRRRPGRETLLNQFNQADQPQGPQSSKGQGRTSWRQGRDWCNGDTGCPRISRQRRLARERRDTGREGKEGPRGTALAYAHLTAEGAVDASLSSNFAGAVISHTTGSGIYCISGLSFTPHSIVASIDSTVEPGVAEASVKPTTFVASPASNQIELVTFNPNIGAKEYKLGDYATFVLLN
jgi:hypothetical protein